MESQLVAIRGPFVALGIVDPGTSPVQRALQGIQSCIDGLKKDSDLGGLLAHEGNAARLYWGLLSGEPLPWAPWARKRVPEHWLRVWPREYGAKKRVQDATDPFNAILNYGYTLLEVEMRIACMAHGFDPDLGLIHVDSRLRESLIYDLKEPIRTAVDTLSVTYCRSEVLRPHMFIELREGVVRLDPDFAGDYAAWLMPQLRKPAEAAAAEFAREIRQIVIPYRLVDDRKATKATGLRKSPSGLCGFCKDPLRKLI